MRVRCCTLVRALLALACIAPVGSAQSSSPLPAVGKLAVTFLVPDGGGAGFGDSGRDQHLGIHGAFMNTRVALLGVMPSGAWDAPPAAEAPNQCPPTPGQAVVDLVNAERAERGLRPYRVNTRLQVAALAHAKDLASAPDIGHRGTDGSDPGRRADRAGYPWTSIGENVAGGQTSPSEVVGAWMASEGHRHNVLHGRYLEVAVGYESMPASRWGTYWVMVFGTSDDPDAGGRRCNP